MFLFLTKIDGEVVSRGIDGKSLNTGLFVELTKKKKIKYKNNNILTTIVAKSAGDLNGKNRRNKTRERYYVRHRLQWSRDRNWRPFGAGYCLYREVTATGNW